MLAPSAESGALPAGLRRPPMRAALWCEGRPGVVTTPPISAQLPSHASVVTAPPCLLAPSIFLNCWRCRAARRKVLPPLRSSPVNDEDLDVSRDWQVRRIKVDEGLRLRALRLQALADAPTAFGSTHAREEKFAEDVWHRRAADGAAGLASVTIVAEQADRLVGMASGLATDATEANVIGPVLVGMFVDRSVRRLGIGEALIESVKTWARSRGHVSLHLWAVSSNAPALALYRRCGFRDNGVTRPLSHTPGLSELQMLVPLPAG